MLFTKHDGDSEFSETICPWRRPMHCHWHAERQRAKAGHDVSQCGDHCAAFQMSTNEQDAIIVHLGCLNEKFEIEIEEEP
jgi:hypothetical protein